MDPDRTRLFELVEAGNLQGSKELAEDIEAKKRREGDSLLNAVNGNRWNVLHVAAYNNHPSIIKWLLSSEGGGGRAAGFTNILAKDLYERTALHLAAGRGYLECCRALVDGCKIENGERAELLNAVSGATQTTLHYAAENDHPSIIQWLLSLEEGGGRAAGFTNILGKDEFERTALHIATERGHLECCQALVDGCKIENGERAELLNAVNDDRWNALCAAANSDHPTIIRWLLSSEEGGGRAAGFTSASITATDNFSRSALHVAATNRSVECLNALLSECTAGERLTLFLCVDDQGWTALHHAARSSNVNMIRELLHYPETQTIVDHRDNRGMTALHRAVIGGVDEGSRKEWKIWVDLNNFGQAAIVEALLTAPRKVDNEEKEGGQQQQDEGKREDKDKSQEQQQQAAVVDPNLGTKIE